MVSKERYTIGLNRSTWSAGKHVDRICSPVPSIQAGRSKMTPRLRAALENGMLLWPTRSEEGRSILGTEPIRRISVLSSRIWGIFSLFTLWTGRIPGVRGWELWPSPRPGCSIHVDYGVRKVGKLPVNRTACIRLTVDEEKWPAEKGLTVGVLK